MALIHFRILGLLKGAQHQVGKKLLLRLATHLDHKLLKGSRGVPTVLILLQRIPELGCQLQEGFDFGGIGIFMNPVNRRDLPAGQVLGNGLVGQQHEFFDNTMSLVSLGTDNVGNFPFVVIFDLRFGKIKIDGPPPHPHRPEDPGQL